jgi:uncharacterized protein YbjT (DUF2867 family)
MTCVVIGGTGRIGSQVVATLRAQGLDAVPASPQTGVDTVSGAGLAAALAGANAVVDVSNAPSFADDAVMAFFTTATTNLLREASAAGVSHVVALSVVGCDRVPDSGYLRAKSAQEQLIRESPLPYTIVRATQFLEFVGSIADAATTDGTVRVPPVRVRPIAAADVAAAVARAAAGAPANGVVEIAGPEEVGFDALVRDVLRARGDARRVVADPEAQYFGARLDEHSLVPIGTADYGRIGLRDWLEGAAGSAR